MCISVDCSFSINKVIRDMFESQYNADYGRKENILVIFCLKSFILTITSISLSSCCRLNIITATPLMWWGWWYLLLLRRSWWCAPTLSVVLSAVSSISTCLWTCTPTLILLHHVTRRAHRSSHHGSTHLSIRSSHRPHIASHSHRWTTLLRWTPLTLMTVVHLAGRISWLGAFNLNLKIDVII